MAGFLQRRLQKWLKKRRRAILKAAEKSSARVVELGPKLMCQILSKIESKNVNSKHLLPGLSVSEPGVLDPEGYQALVDQSIPWRPESSPEENRLTPVFFREL